MKFQVAVERTKPNGRIVGIDIIPAQPPKGVSTIQGNFLSNEVREEVKRFLRDPDRGRPNQALSDDDIIDAPSYIDLERHLDEITPVVKEGKDGKEEGEKKLSMKRRTLHVGRVVDIVLSDMSAPWDQTTGFWKRSLSDPYIRMMNTSGINFKDHAGSMVSFYPFFVQAPLRTREKASGMRIWTDFD